nr:hypothetical protein [Defluviimonas sp.]
MTTNDLARLIRQSDGPARGALPFLGALSLARARVHEFCGPARRTLALMAARATKGPVLWIRPGWMPERLFPEGVVAFIEPGRLLFATPRRPEDLLWCVEEALRCAATPLVVAELPEPPRLTPVRRLQLAAETGAREGHQVPTGLVLTPGDGGAQGVESRWRLAPRHRAGQSGWQLDLLRSRNGPPACWSLRASAGMEAEPRAEKAGGDGRRAGFTLAQLPAAAETGPDRTDGRDAGARQER